MSDAVTIAVITTVPITLNVLATIFYGGRVQRVQSELKPNGGNSFRDQVNKRFTAQDDRLDEIYEAQSKKTEAYQVLATAVKQLQNDHAEIKHRLDEVPAQLQEVREEVQKQQAFEKGMELRVARYVKHELRGTINTSKLIQELRERLTAEEGPEAAEAAIKELLGEKP